MISKKAKPRFATIAGKRVVVLSVTDYERLARKADEWEPQLPAPNARGNYPLEALDVLVARKLLRRRRALGLSQGELARKAGIRPATLNRIEQGKHVPSILALDKLDQALTQAELADRNGRRKRQNGK